MSKEKQIKEMAKELCGYSKPNGNCEFDDKPCNLECIYGRCAEIIYTAGYRKQSEGEWIWKSNGYMKRPHCSCCDKQKDWETSYCPSCGAKMKGGAG